jgi:hypothetical protein
MDKTLTIWGSKVTLSGFESSTKRSKKYAIKYLKKNGLYVVTDSPTTHIRFKKDGTTVSMKVKNLLTGTIFYTKTYYIEGKGTKAIKNTISRSVDDFKKVLPYHGLVYSKRREIIKINAGTSSGITKGDRFETIRFKGEIPETIQLETQEFEHDLTGEIEILSAKRYTSVAKIISETLVRKFDKIVIDREAGRFTSDPVKKGIKLLFGTSTGVLKVEGASDSTANEKPDSGKELKFANPIPTFGLNVWFSKKYGANLTLQYRKIPLALTNGTKIKATYMVVSPELLYSFGDFDNGNVIVLALGAYVYYNTVGEKLMYYISTKYIAPQLGFDWSKKDRAHTGTFRLRFFPMASLTEDQAKRGESSSSSGWNIELIYDYDITVMCGVSSSLFYRRIKTTFSGEPSVGIDEDDTYEDSQYGVKLLLSFYFPT